MEQIGNINYGMVIDIKKLETYLKNGNEGECVKLLSYIHFEDLLIIKKITINLRNTIYFFI